MFLPNSIRYLIIKYMMFNTVHVLASYGYVLYRIYKQLKYLFYITGCFEF